jgi:hypothetical protein
MPDQTAPDRSEAVRTILNEYIQRSGVPLEAIRNDASPIDNYGMKSLDGLDFIDLVGEQIGCEFSPTFNPFVNDQGRPATVSEVVESIVKTAASGTAQ